MYIYIHIHQYIILNVVFATPSQLIKTTYNAASALLGRHRLRRRRRRRWTRLAAVRLSAIADIVQNSSRRLHRGTRERPIDLNWNCVKPILRQFKRAIKSTRLLLA